MKRSMFERCVRGFCCGIFSSLLFLSTPLVSVVQAQEPEVPATSNPPSPDSVDNAQEPAQENAGQGTSRAEQERASRAALEAFPGMGSQAPTHWETADKALPFSLNQDEQRFRRLGPDDEVWIDVKQNLVIVGAQVALQRGVLEMFACPAGTKEHESVLAVNSRAFVIHTALLAVKAEPGHPVQFDPEYKAAEGQEIEIYVVWNKDDQPQWARAQDWIKDQQKDQAMDVPFVFGGSGFFRDENTGERHYMAESGELICLSNFSTAMLDLPIKSSDSDAALLFEAFGDRIPARGSRVTLVLVPKAKEAQEQEEQQ